MLQNLQKQNMDAELKILRGLLLDMLVRGLPASSQAIWFRRIPTILTSCSSSMDDKQAVSNTAEMMSVSEVPIVSHPEVQEASLVQPQVTLAFSRCFLTTIIRKDLPPFLVAGSKTLFSPFLVV